MHSNFRTMKRSVLNTIAIGLGLVLSISSCEKNIDIDIDEISPMIVLNALVEADSAVEISLSRTRHILDNKEVSTLNSGKVNIFDSHGNSAELFLNSRSRYVADNFQIIPGEEYRITASAEGYYDVEATCTIPQRVDIIRIDTVSVYNEWNDQMLSLGIVFRDDPDVDNYYQLSMMAKWYMYEWYIEERIDTLYVDPVKDTIILGIVYDTIERYIPYYEQTYFNTEDLIIEEWDNMGGVVFSDKLIQGKEYAITGNIYSGYSMWSADTSTLYVNLHSISKDYFDYVSSLQKHYNAKGDPFSTPVVVHSNVTNGLGIFGARSTSRDSIRLAPNPNDDFYWRID